MKKLKELIEQLGYTVTIGEDKVRIGAEKLFCFKSKLIFMIYIDTWENKRENIILAVLNTLNHNILTYTPLDTVNELTTEELEHKLNAITSYIQEQMRNKKKFDAENLKKQNKVYAINYYYDNEEETISEYMNKWHIKSCH